MISICAAYDFTIGLDAEGCVWGWGYNMNGQLGLGQDTQDHLKPKKIPLPDPVTSISVGDHHTIVLTST